MIKCQTIVTPFRRHSGFVLRHLLLAVMMALKDSLGTEFAERVRAIFSEDGLLSKAKIGT